MRNPPATAENVLSADACVRRWLDEFTNIAAGRYRFFACGFITSKNALFSAAFIEEHCTFFNKALARLIAGEVASHIESFARDLQETVDSAPDMEQAAEEIQRAAKKFALYFAAVFKPLFMRCAARCFTESDGLVFSLRELETLTSEFHTDISTRIKRHKAGLIEVLRLQHRISAQALEASAEVSEKAAAHNSPAPEDGGRKAPEKHNTPVTPDGVSLPDFTLVDAFGRGLLGPLEDYYSIAGISIRGPLNPTVFPRAFCGPTLKILKNYLIGRDKYNAANNALLKGIAQLCSESTGPDRTVLRSFYAGGKLKPYFIGYFLHILKVLLNEDKKENFIRRLNADPALGTDPQDAFFKERHLNMLTNAWARFTRDNLDSVTARKAASAILVEYIPAAYSAEEIAALSTPKANSPLRRKTRRKAELQAKA